MRFPPVPAVDEVAQHFGRRGARSAAGDGPYRHWALQRRFPGDLCVGILMLPIAPPVMGRTDGARNTYNDIRAASSRRAASRFPDLRGAVGGDAAPGAGARCWRRPAASRSRAAICAWNTSRTLDGAWLEPHRDIKEKLFSMVVYLCTGPDAEDWGTDIYDDEKRWVGR